MQQGKKEIKGMKIGKKEMKLSLFGDDMIICVENRMKSTKKLLELISDFSKIAGYKVNILHLIVFLDTSNDP